MEIISSLKEYDTLILITSCLLYTSGLARGADTIISGGGYGPCRAGLYGEIHRRILNDLGYDPNICLLYTSRCV